ncbi:MAG: DUF1667 domain-containing protein [Angelakisella sp.]
MTKAEYTCIVCPVSCRVTVTESPDGLQVTGNQCKRGEKHAKAEHTQPLRMLTSTVKVSGGRLPRLPVISTAEIPKAKMQACLAQLYAVTVTAPVKCGQVILANVGSTGVDIVAGRTMDAVE